MCNHKLGLHGLKEKLAAPWRTCGWCHADCGPVSQILQSRPDGFRARILDVQARPGSLRSTYPYLGFVARDTRLHAFAATRVLQESGGLTLIPTSPPCCSHLEEVAAAVVFCCVSWCDYILASPKASETSVNVTCALDPGTYPGTYSTQIPTLSRCCPSASYDLRRGCTTPFRVT